MSKAIPSENLPEASAPAQETGSPGEASIQSTGDQANGVVETQEIPKQAEETEPVIAPVSLQGAAADSAGDSAEAVEAKTCDDPKPATPQEDDVKSEEGKAADSPKTVAEDDAAQEKVVPVDVSVAVATQSENPEEPAALHSKATEAKGTSKCEGPPLSTHHLSGWFIL